MILYWLFQYNSSTEDIFFSENELDWAEERAKKFPKNKRIIICEYE